MQINFTETVLGDGNQFLSASCMPFSDFEGILEKLDQAGYYSLECWSGTIFDSCLRRLNEDPWERLRKIKARVTNTPLQMLFNGQNILGRKQYPDDVVRKFVSKSIENGISILRIFDGLNDFRNLQTAIDETLKCGGHAQGCICYSLSPIYNLEKYKEMGKQLESLGANSICLKDTSGMIEPGTAFDLIKCLKESVSIPVFVHTNSKTGLGTISYIKAAEAGCDGIDTAVSAFSGGTSQPATETMLYSLKNLGFESSLNTTILKEINDFFKQLKLQYLNSGLIDPYVMETETDSLAYQVPDSMLLNLLAQLKSQNAADRLNDVLAEVLNVRKDLGYPPLVTPVSQIIGGQASLNVLSGERYKNISKEVEAYLKGEFGQAPGYIDQDLQQKVLGGDTPFTGRYADTLQPGFDTAKKEKRSLFNSQEDVLSYIVFPQAAEKFLKDREESKARTVSYVITKTSGGK